jgi:Peptidase propeptide and YPEB domain
MLRMSLGLVVAAACLAPVASFAGDREPTADERASIEAVLQGEGFVKWDEIEWDDDGYWKIDDAETADGQDFDVRLDQTFNVIEREKD